MELQSISHVSKTFGISTRMLRYYEEMGLIYSVRNEESSYRYYDELALKRVQQIIILRKLQIPVKQIKVIIDNPSAIEVIRVFEQNITEIDEQITALSTLKSILAQFVAQLQEKANVRIKLDLLNEASMIAVVNSLSFSDNKIKEKLKTEEMNRASEILERLSDKDVRIIFLPSSAVASALTFGEKAEHDTDVIMGKFVTDADLLKVNPGAKFYGFNNPEFDENNNFVKHGYEVWATIPGDFEVPAPLIKKVFTGGLYAAYTSKPVDFDDWKYFFKWLDESEDFEHDLSRPYESVSKLPGKHGCSGWGCLEEHINSYNFYGLKNKKHILTHLDFLIPIKEKGKENG